MGPVLAIMKKDLILLSRDRLNAFFTFIFPVFISIFFGAIFSGGGSSAQLSLVVLDQSGSPSAARFIESLKNDAALKVRTAPDLPAAEDLVRKGTVEAAVVFPQDFKDGVESLLSGKSMNLEILVSPKGQAEAGLLTGKLSELAFRQMSDSFTDLSRTLDFTKRGRETVSQSRDLSLLQKSLFSTLFDTVDSLSSSAPQQAETGGASSGGTAFRPINVTTRELAVKTSGPLNSFEISFPQGVVWGLMGCIMAFSTSVVAERARGTLTRLRVAPISRTQILGGKALACFVTCCLMTLIMLAIAVLLLGVSVGNWAMMAGAILLSGLGCTGIMLLIAGLSKTEGAANGLGRGMMIVLAMVGGGSIPVSFMPPLLRKLSGFSPFTWVVNSLEGAMWRDFTLADMTIPAAVLCSIAVGGLLIGVSTLRWAE